MKTYGYCGDVCKMANLLLHQVWKTYKKKKIYLYMKIKSLKYSDVRLIDI